jgi:hypothetical protein
MNIRSLLGGYKSGGIVIGYAIYLVDELSYEYNEDSCFIFSSRATAEKLASELYCLDNAYRIVPVRIKEIMNDFGSSSHNYATEPGAMKRFEKVASKNKIFYESELWEAPDDLIILEVYPNRKI